MGSKLFEPLKVGSVTVKHRIAMAPLTRFRADDDHTPLLPLVGEYYAQRASVPGTLLISEATFVSPRASGYSNVPGLFADSHLKAWKQVTDAVHAKGSYIFVQLWCLGRAATPAVLEPKGLDVISAGDIPIGPGRAKPRSLSEDEIWALIGEYKEAARRAVEEGGFDGVEIHGANGYMVDQFIQSNSNNRTDSWGGSIENRSRFAVEVAKAVSSAIGADRTAIRLSPWSTFQGMRMPDPLPQFTDVISKLKELKLAYLHLVTSRVQGEKIVEAPEEGLEFAFKAWGGVSPIVLAGGFTNKLAKEAVDETFPNDNVLIAFGRYFISTPDLPFRLEKGLDINDYNRKTFYTPKAAEGYVDYPFSKEWEESRL